MQTTYLKNYTVPDFLIEKTELHFDIHDDYTKVTAILQMHRNPESAHRDAPLVLDGESLELQSITIDRKKCEKNNYTVSETHLTIPVVPDQFFLETQVIIYPKKNTALMGLYQSRNNLCTQCEAEGFRTITYYLDRPDVMSRFTTTICADQKQFPYLLSNGNLIEEKILPNNRHWVKWEDPSKKPCYLFALVAGDFDVMRDQFETMSGRTVDLYLYLEKGFLDQGDYAMIALKKSMKWDEEKFGREYDLDRFMTVAVSDFNMGAMENKGLNIFNTKYILAKPQTATDMDYVNIDRVVGHEYFHNWSGNRITCRDWFQLTLKEGLTVFRDHLFTEDMTSYGVARIDGVNTLRNHQFPEDASPMAHPIRPDHYQKIDNFYTATVYEKGSEVIRMVRTLITPVVFRKAMDNYFEKFDGQAVTTEDFLSVMQETSGKDLSQFSRWYHQAGTPILRVKTHYDVDKKTFDVIVKQHTPATAGQEEKLPLHLPLAMGLIGKDCRDLPLQLQGENADNHTTIILEVKKPEETFTFVNVDENPVPSFLRHFSAPVELQYDYSDAELAKLLQCDSDAFAKWEAGQRLFVNIVRKAAESKAANKPIVIDPIFFDSIEALLKNDALDPELLSRIVLFPSLKYLLTHIKEIDLDIVFSAKKYLETEMAKKFEKHWMRLYDQNQIKTAYQYDAKLSGRRRLKSVCLYYLLLTEKNNDVDLAREQFLSADNMTDQLGALSALNNHAVPVREQSLSDFYHQYQHEPLVVNKWLSLHASTTLPSAVEDVKKLLQHPGYDKHNPNNIYALLVTFGQNTLRFNDKNGVGYQLIAEQVLSIDAQNPQVAVRVVQPLTQWRQMDVVRGKLMQAQLQRMMKEKLSANLYEIVSKSV